jgi:hypothetical protein
LYICVSLDPNFKIHDTLTVNFQIQTFAHDGLVLWISDPLPESSFTIEIQNRQVRSYQFITETKKFNTFSLSLGRLYAVNHLVFVQSLQKIVYVMVSGIAFKYVLMEVF